MEHWRKRDEAPVPPREIEVEAKKVVLHGEARIPDDAQGVVLLVHASGHERLKTHHRALANVLAGASLGTVCIDLLPEGDVALESKSGRTRDAVRLLSDRLVTMTHWVERIGFARKDQPLGYLAIGRAVPAVCVLCASTPTTIRGVVCWEGRPALSPTLLERIQVPMALLVGGLHDSLLEANVDAYTSLRCHRDLQVIAGAKHLMHSHAFGDAAHRARNWLTRCLVAQTVTRRVPPQLLH